MDAISIDPVTAEPEAWPAAATVAAPLLPLYVDLDGTLARTDLLWETWLAAVRARHPAALAFFWWLLVRGRAYAKDRLADEVHPDLDALPLDQSVVRHIQAWRQRGGAVYLATAASGVTAERIAARLGLFDGVLASSRDTNLKGRRKLQAIQAHCGSSGFAYVGDSSADLPILQQASARYLVPRAAGLLQRMRATGLEFRTLGEAPALLPAAATAARLHQWVKNLLLFVPMLASHRWSDLQAWKHLLVAFVALGLVASATYVLNDLLDLQADRQHPRKRSRPLASGRLLPGQGAALAAGLLAAGFAASLGSGPAAAMALLLYLGSTLAYSLLLKKYVLVDVVMLAGLYTLRIGIGAYLIGVGVSSWLLCFSVAVFLSLALVKRCAELRAIETQSRTQASGRDYNVEDLAHLTSMGVASGYAAVILLALYVETTTAARMYSNPHMFWLACVFLLYWISRLWLKTGRAQMHDDPIVFSLKDRGSLVTLVGAFACYLAALL